MVSQQVCMCVRWKRGGGAGEGRKNIFYLADKVVLGEVAWAVQVPHPDAIQILERIRHVSTATP